MRGGGSFEDSFYFLAVALLKLSRPALQKSCRQDDGGERGTGNGQVLVDPMDQVETE